MKELKHLNKYLYKYKHLLILGVVFLIISNYFAVWPAKVVRYAIDYVTSLLVNKTIEVMQDFNKRLLSPKDGKEVSRLVGRVIDQSVLFIERHDVSLSEEILWNKYI